MRKIANIITDSQQTYFSACDLYNIVKTKDELIEGLPTLIIGWKKVSEICSDINVSILDWKINDCLFWCFARRERGENYEIMTKKFENMVISKIIKTLKYEYINLLTEDKEKKKIFLEKLGNDTDKTIYIENDVVFICFNKEDTIYGFSLFDIDYMGKNRKNVLSLLYGNNKNNIIKNTSLPIDIKMTIKNVPYVIPWLYS